jgi:hypothetical protein
MIYDRMDLHGTRRLPEIAIHHSEVAELLPLRDADLVKLVDETITAFPRVWSRSDDGVSAQLHEEDHLKPEPGNNKIVSYPSNSFRQARPAVGL